MVSGFKVYLYADNAYQADIDKTKSEIEIANLSSLKADWGEVSVIALDIEKKQCSFNSLLTQVTYNLQIKDVLFGSEMAVYDNLTKIANKYSKYLYCDFATGGDLYPLRIHTALKAICLKPNKFEISIEHDHDNGLKHISVLCENLYPILL